MIYFIQDCETENIKIGFAKEPKNRLTNLQTATSNNLNLLAEMNGDRIKEQEIHKLFSSDLVRGEWFKFSNKLKRFIDENAQLVKTINKSKISNEDLEYIMNHLDCDDDPFHQSQFKHDLEYMKRELHEGRKREEIVFWYKYGQNLAALQGIEDEEDPECIKIFIDFFMDYVNTFKERLNEKKII